MLKIYPRPTGELQGDSSAMPMKSVGDMAPENYGADLSPDATNRIVGIAGSTKSDADGDA